MKNAFHKLVMVAATITAILGTQAVASAQYGGYGYGHGHDGYGGYGHVHQGYRGYGYGYGGYGSGYSTYRGYYHDTSHFDYHAPSLQRHGNHYHYVPGHYDYHRTGHYHP